MGLTNAEYNEILREYDEKQSRDRHELATRREKAYAAIPVLSELDERIASNSVRAATLAIRGDDSAVEDNRRIIEMTISQKAQLLRQAGFPENYLEMQYQCPLCKDTGYTEEGMCACFKQAIINHYYLAPGLKDLLKKEKFSAFNPNYYSDETYDETTGDSYREVAIAAYQKAFSYVEHFADNRRNLLLTGPTGTGKTFLSNCIAGALMEQGYTVLYLSATRLFDIFDNYRFGNAENSNQAMRDYDMVLDCDLLIIDDLGSEIGNAYTISQLFICMEERLLRAKSIVISTNITMDQIRARYSERIASRLFNNYQYIKLMGDDIRVRKLFLEGSPD
ncbi:MAG: ATP-binding protein [Lachnospiraceae bacterium]|nr:ATP-binding protein [Lachnospiraceae bacterium]